jgi:hypothetical protein
MRSRGLVSANGFLGQMDDLLPDERRVRRLAGILLRFARDGDTE